MIFLGIKNPQCNLAVRAHLTLTGRKRHFSEISKSCSKSPFQWSIGWMDAWTLGRCG